MPHELTARESFILQQRTAGQSVRSIAEALHLTEARVYQIQKRARARQEMIETAHERTARHHARLRRQETEWYLQEAYLWLLRANGRAVRRL